MRRLLGYLAFAALAVMALPQPFAHAEEDSNFFSRFINNYKFHMDYTGENTPAAAYRGIEPPLDSPPFPGSDYSYGGSQVIGHTALYYGPLTDTIWASEWGQSLKENNITVYGWAEPGGNLSTATHKWSQSTGTGGNFPMAYDTQPNTVELDQFALYVERVPDEVQTDHVDWGFRFTTLYGQDYRYTFSHDNNSSERLKRNNLYGYDFCLMCYGEIYIPNVADGMQIRVGRYISIPDIEAQLAPNNYTYTHSLLYSFDPYTQTGIVNSIKLNRNWSVQFEISGGNDIMPWDSRYAQVTPAFCAEWTADDGSDVIYPCVIGINNQKYGSNNTQELVSTWYHKFDSKWHTDSEFWYMWQRDTPNALWTGPSSAQTAPILGANEAYCVPTKPNCFSREYALVNYLSYEIDHLNSISIRNEFMNDINGQRSGIPTWYSEHMIGWTHWIGDVITIRPELAYARSYTHNAFDASSSSLGTDGISSMGTSNNLLLFSADVIIHY